MKPRIVLASSSQIRSRLLNNAGIQHQVLEAVIDEEAVKAALESEGVSHRDIVDTLADMKAKKVANQFADAFTIGCDQIVVFHDKIFSKPKTKADMNLQIKAMKGQSHEILSAAVIYDGNLPIWRCIGRTKVTLRDLPSKYIKTYVNEHWETTKNCVGCYEVERNGAKIIKKIEGDFFNILGMPLLEILDSLEIHGILYK